MRGTDFVVSGLVRRRTQVHHKPGIVHVSSKWPKTSLRVWSMTRRSSILMMNLLCVGWFRPQCGPQTRSICDGCVPGELQVGTVRGRNISNCRTVRCLSQRRQGCGQDADCRARPSQFCKWDRRCGNRHCLLIQICRCRQETVCWMHSNMIRCASVRLLRQCQRRHEQCEQPGSPVRPKGVPPCQRCPRTQGTAWGPQWWT